MIWSIQDKAVWKARSQSSAFDAASLASLHAAHGEWLLRRITKKFGRDDAEDIVQETWLRVGPYSQLNAIEHPKAFLLTIASNLARNIFASRMQRSSRAGSVVAAHYEQAPQPTVVLGHQLLVGLPAPLRDVFVLSRIVGLTNAQIAEQLGISPKTVEGRMTKALAHCAAQLRR